MSNALDQRLGTIVVGVDGSDSSLSALRWAARQASLTGHELDAVIAWNLPNTYGWAPLPDVNWEAEARTALEQAVREALDPAQAATVHQQVREGHPAHVLLEVAQRADLLVVGSRGLGGFAGMLLGSISMHVVTHARCPVVVVHDTTQPPSHP
jgi:nucleotide-binding universal stress UspA family protein